MQRYHVNGITTVPESPAVKDNVNIYYNGLLPRSGAPEVYAHFTFDNNWYHVQEHKMTKYNHLGPNSQSIDDAILTFHTSVQIPPHARTLDICFRDSSNHWDNNSGQNYTIGLDQEGSFREGVYNPARTREDFAQMENSSNEYMMIEQGADGSKTYRYPSGT